MAISSILTLSSRTLNNRFAEINVRCVQAGISSGNGLTGMQKICAALNLHNDFINDNEIFLCTQYDIIEYRCFSSRQSVQISVRRIFDTPPFLDVTNGMKLSCSTYSTRSLYCFFFVHVVVAFT